MGAEQARIRALKVSAIATASVVAVEVSSGLLTGSLAIASDGAHALLDAVATFVLLIAARASLKPPDEEHTYGHEKVEALGGLLGGIMLLGVVALVSYEASLRLARGGSYIAPAWEGVGFAAIAYTLFVEGLRVAILRRAGGSTTVRAGLYHALADMGSTLVALLGFGLAVLGLPLLDPLASLALCAALAYLSLRLAWSSGAELIDAAPRGAVEAARRVVESTEGVLRVEGLRVRRAGARTFVEATIKVPGHLSLEDAHALASKVEEGLKRGLRGAEVMIHVEPSEGVGRLVEEVARGVEGVRGVHEVSAAYAHGRLNITLHAYVDPGLSVREAHELAARVEEGLRRRVGPAAEVVVHVEPADSRQRGAAADEEGLRRAVHEAAERLGGVVVRRVVTYVAEGRRYVNVDCYLPGRTSVEEAHGVASRIEEEVRRRFTETVVTVHVEPLESASRH